MAEAIMKHGTPTMIDWTAAADIDAGEVVLISNTKLLGIAHLDIANGEQGTLAIDGAVYDVKVAGNYAAGEKVWWDNAANACTTTSTNNTPFGWTVELSPAANSVVKVMNHPF
jgi:predicted RecA/RadA family phage recombinase